MYLFKFLVKESDFVPDQGLNYKELVIIAHLNALWSIDLGTDCRE